MELIDISEVECERKSKIKIHLSILKDGVAVVEEGREVRNSVLDVLSLTCLVCILVEM